MTPKSQALMLADKLDEGNIDRSTLTEAANELRRLDDINNDLMATLRWYIENDDVLLYQDGMRHKQQSPSQLEKTVNDYESILEDRNWIAYIVNDSRICEGIAVVLKENWFFKNDVLFRSDVSCGVRCFDTDIDLLDATEFDCVYYVEGIK